MRVLRNHTDTVADSSGVVGANRFLAAVDDPTVAIEALLDAIVERAGTGVAVFDRDLRFVWVNSVTAQINRLPVADHVGRTVDEVLPGAAASLVPVLSEVLVSGEPVLHVEVSAAPRSVRERPRWWSGSYIRLDVAGPTSPFVVAVFTEVTDRVLEANRLSALAAVSGELNSADTTAEVIRVLHEHTEAAEAADFVNVSLHDPETESLHVAQPASLAADVADRWSTISLVDGPSTPQTDAFRHAKMVAVSSGPERRDRYPHLWRETSAVGLEATAGLPLLDESGSVFGVLGLGWQREVSFDAVVRDRLELLADLAGEALQRTRRAEAVNHLVSQLQRELLMGQDDAPGLDVAVGYEAAMDAIGFGGDWYDVIAAGGSTALVVGDVAGHGIAAAAQMAQAKSTVRTVVANDATFGEVFPRATRALDYLHEAYVATAGIAMIDLERAELRWLRAGHLPALLRQPGGEVELLWGGCQRPIGVPDDRSIEPVHRRLQPGTTVLLYTDGLIERRDRTLDEGLDLLVDVVARLPDGLGAAAVRDAVLGRFLPEGTVDDVAIVVAVVEP
jgi:PAS domain-containing protein